MINMFPCSPESIVGKQTATELGVRDRSAKEIVQIGILATNTLACLLAPELSHFEPDLNQF